ncbi:beta-ketoacyl-[acyl-carrier-protein] synthase family protein [Chitinophaga silvatica]|uniref:3-oxoacyl-[acyl-carrier-protein] synthase 1 n=1 Tax=Chitinophaga silvatica TaxID=2282649 RepID=A0A3E1YH49_9BACT|nr:beta-ketoacyl-[acyl-carrier-protein] synthase family protein [Chitinophaga silvatica]RFS26540.1 beta-ketoacyl-[acyl-carrier-protein] synthase family protein [Chitinophaga silvatica]
MSNRVVITGIGVVSPNGVGIPAFRKALQEGVSGIRHSQQLATMNFSCQIAGQPIITEDLLAEYFDELELKLLSSSGIIYGIMAGIQAWKDAGLTIRHKEEEPDWDSGTIFGTGTSGVDKFRESIYKLDEGQVRRLGSAVVPQTMASGVSAYLGGKLGLGNQITTNSSACTTGTEGLILAYERIKNGSAKRMLAGAASDSGPYIWGGFDALKVCTYKYNSEPEKGSRPMSASASGIVPGSGAGALLLESLEEALQRGANIYAEVVGGHINGGGQRNGGSMTAPNSYAVQRCIRSALADAKIKGDEVDVINGHLTATGKDAEEVRNWSEALDLKGNQFPYLNALKSMTGHCLAASGSIELVAAALQLKEGFIFPNVNCEDVHPEILSLIDKERIPQTLLYKSINLLAKASFGFGDVNACVILKRYLQP